MPRSRSSKSLPDDIIEKLRNLLWKYLEKLDSIKPSLSNIFKNEQAKIDFETKVWHHFHKIESAEYHSKQVINLTTKAREHFKSVKMPEVEGSAEFRFTFQDQKILFELEAFFAAVQSALDFLACVLSRYIKGKNTDKFDRLQRFLENSADPIAVLINQAWLAWTKDTTNYRDYLIHRGVLPAPIATGVTVSNPKLTDTELKHFSQLISSEQNFVVFPVPIKPDPRIRITRREILGLDEPQIPPGIVETTTEITLSSKNTDTGPKVSVSIGRNVGSSSIHAKSDIQLGRESERIRSIQYKLAPGYIEASSLCEDIFDKSINLSLEIFSELNRSNFVHIS